jgi:hypothetical protein
VIDTGLEKITVCHPDAVSPVNVADARSCPAADHKLPICAPVFAAALSNRSPVTCPLVDAVNFTPSSTELLSPESSSVGVSEKSKMVSSGVAAGEVPAALVPVLLVAVTWNVYAVPFVSPVSVADVADAPACTAVPAVDPAYGVTVYPEIGLPPLLLGAVQLTNA